MKKYFIFFILLLPSLIFAQPTKQKGSAKVPSIKPKQKIDGFVINGDISGFADGTSVTLLNAQTGAVEVETKIKNANFILKGKMASPDFRLLTFNKKQPYITIFLDNSTVKIIGKSAALDKAIITGSASNLDYYELNKTVLSPYQSLFDENVPYDTIAAKKAKELFYNFAVSHSKSFINPLAIYKYNQLAEDITKTEFLYDKLTPSVKASPMGMAVAQMIDEAKRNAVGTEFPNFTQADTTGNMVSLSSFRGKYVLVDFWASWCKPCRQENPNVLSAYNKFKNKNFTVIGVSLDKAKVAWVSAINMDGLVWTHVSDLQGWSNAVAQKNQIFSIPQNFLLDPQGKIIAKDLKGASLERKLSQVLK